MTYFTQAGDAYMPTAGRDTMLDTLPVANYLVVKPNPMGPMFFQRVDKFADPGKTYGDLDSRAERILRTFLDRPRATGVLLAGEKGSGKSMLARVTSYKGYQQGIPTILVNHPWHGEEFANLLASIEQPAIVLMDEFEKVYNKNELQEQILTLLDGTMTTKKLFILTVNDTWRVDQHMKNRPGRLFYNLDFDGLTAEFIRQYCDDTLDNKDHIEDVVKISNLFEKFNFDMLKGLVEEMNRYKEDPYDAVKMLNIKPVTSQRDAQYTCEVWDADGNPMEIHGNGIFNNTPMTESEFGLHVAPKPTEEELEEAGGKKRRGGYPFEWFMLEIEVADIVRLDGGKGIFEFKVEGEDSKEYTVLFTKKPSAPYTLRSLAY